MEILPNAVTPEMAADKYVAHILGPRIDAIAGKNGKVDPTEAAKDPFVKDAYAATGFMRPSKETVRRAGRAKMLAAARQAAGPDGRLSRVDSRGMEFILKKGFEFMRDSLTEGKDLSMHLQRLANGLLFMSESDYPYEGVYVKLDPGQPLNEATFKAVLDWTKGPPGETVDRGEDFRLEIYMHNDEMRDNHPIEDDGASSEEQRQGEQGAAIDDVMDLAFVPVRGDSSATVQAWDAPHSYKPVEGEIWVVTPREHDSSLSPYYVLGRLPNGDLAGLKTYRVWT